MTRMDRTRSAAIALAGTAAITALASFTPSSASAADYDMDCKLILCMPAGFPSGCRDAFDHMIDRLRDGKSPIGTCTMSNGDAYDRYDIDYAFKPATLPESWACPAGKSLYHTVRSDDDAGRRHSVNTLCYDAAYTQRAWTSDGESMRTIFTNKTIPARTDFWVNLTVEPGTDAAYSQGWQKFDAGIHRDGMTTIHYTE